LEGKARKDKKMAEKLISLAKRKNSGDNNTGSEKNKKAKRTILDDD